MSIYTSLLKIMQGKDEKFATVEKIVTEHIRRSIPSTELLQMPALELLERISIGEFGCIGTWQRDIPAIQEEFPNLALPNRKRNKKLHYSGPTLFRITAKPLLTAIANHKSREGNVWSLEGHIWAKPHTDGLIAVSEYGIRRNIEGEELLKNAYAINAEIEKVRFNGRNSSKLKAYLFSIDDIDNYLEKSVDLSEPHTEPAQ